MLNPPVTHHFFVEIHNPNSVGNDNGCGVLGHFTPMCRKFKCDLSDFIVRLYSGERIFTIVFNKQHHVGLNSMTISDEVLRPVALDLLWVGDLAQNVPVGNPLLGESTGNILQFLGVP